mmetsp:Transcript_10099/g.23673  ORF Transcript_10099/g.23673 Transcript_10099/m.23673 type:complete len:141 (-) Transcript_10099:80-502(-)
MTPLHLAAHTGHVEVAQILVTSGADLNAKDQVEERTPLHNGHAEVAQVLESARADLNVKDKETSRQGTTPQRLEARVAELNAMAAAAGLLPTQHAYPSAQDLWVLALCVFLAFKQGRQIAQPRWWTLVLLVLLLHVGPSF